MFYVMFNVEIPGGTYVNRYGTACRAHIAYGQRVSNVPEVGDEVHVGGFDLEVDEVYFLSATEVYHTYSYIFDPANAQSIIQRAEKLGWLVP